MLLERLEHDVLLFRLIVDLFALLLTCHLPIGLNTIVACLCSSLSSSSSSCFRIKYGSNVSLGEYFDAPAGPVSCLYPR